MQFFIAQTLIVGVAFIVVGFFPAVQSGLLPPAIVFAYNTYLVYGALSNNPEASCNIMARSDNQNQASIIAGLAFAVISVTYAAYSSASSIAKALSMPVTPGEDAATVAAVWVACACVQTGARPTCFVSKSCFRLQQRRRPHPLARPTRSSWARWLAAARRRRPPAQPRTAQRRRRHRQLPRRLRMRLPQLRPVPMPLAAAVALHMPRRLVPTSWRLARGCSTCPCALRASTWPC